MGNNNTQVREKETVSDVNHCSLDRNITSHSTLPWRITTSRLDLGQGPSPLQENSRNLLHSKIAKYLPFRESF